MEYIGIEKYKVVNTVAGKQNGISWKLEFIVLVYRTNNPQINMSFHSCIHYVDSQPTNVSLLTADTVT